MRHDSTIGDGDAGLSPGRFPGDLLLLPVATISLVTLIVNDHVLKQRYANVVTGKLSDLAGLVFLPLLLVALIEVLRAGARVRVWRVPVPVLTICVFLTGVGFTLAKTWAPITKAYCVGTGALEWPAVAVKAAIVAPHLPALPQAHMVRDTTDLLALPMLLMPWWFGRSHLTRDARRLSPRPGGRRVRNQVRPLGPHHALEVIAFAGDKVTATDGTAERESEVD